MRDLRGAPCRLCGLHIRQPARVDFGPFLLWCIVRLHSQASSVSAARVLCSPCLWADQRCFSRREASGLVPNGRRQEIDLVVGAGVGDEITGYEADGVVPQAQGCVADTGRRNFQYPLNGWYVLENTAL